MAETSFTFQKSPEQPLVIAGPCMAETFEIMDEVASHMSQLSKKLGFEYVFKASFDKANRTSLKGERGPGWDKASDWFAQIKAKYNLPLLTDVHETSQVEAVSAICDVLQIPAFLCRQTDLIEAAVSTGRAVNIKKGQFLAPDSVKHIVSKVRAFEGEKGLSSNLAVTERGYTFGYGNLVVDMRALKIISDTGVPTIFDVTHSLQLPASGGASGEVSGGLREFAPVLARSAAATGYCDGFFLEVHPEPEKALSDAATQLSPRQSAVLLEQIVELWRQGKKNSELDAKLFS